VALISVTCRVSSSISWRRSSFADRVCAFLFNEEPPIGFAHPLDDAGESFLRFALGQRLSRQKRAKRLLDLHHLLGFGRSQRASCDRIVDALLGGCFRRQIGNLLSGLRRLLGDAFAQRLARTGFGIDAFAGLIDQAGLAGFRALGRRGAFEIGVRQGQRRADRHLGDGRLRDDGLRRRIDRRSKAGQFSRHAPVGGFDLGDIGKLGTRQWIIERRAQGRLFAAQAFEIARAGNDIAGGFTGPHRQFVRPRFGREPRGTLLLIGKLRFDLGDPPLDLRQHQRHDIAADVLAQTVALPFQEIEFFGRVAAIDGAIHRLADGVKGVRGLTSDIVPSAPEGVGRLFGIGQRRDELI
jgi:hypothetical protein